VTLAGSDYLIKINKVNIVPLQAKVLAKLPGQATHFKGQENKQLVFH